MSQVFSEAYEKALHKPFKENWLVKLFHSDDPDNNPNDCIKIAFGGTTCDDQYYEPAIMGNPGIHRSIDLIECEAKTDNLSLELANIDIDGSKLSELLIDPDSANQYLNKHVLIYSQLNDENDLSECHLMFEGKLHAAKMPGTTVKLEIYSHRPWAEIKLPNSIDRESGKNIPVAYGDFTKNESTYLSPDYCLSKALRAVQVRNIQGEYINCLDIMHTITDCNLHYYEKSLDKFIPLYTAFDVGKVVNGADILYGYKKLMRGFKFKPTAIVDGSDDFTNPEYAIDKNLDDDSTAAVLDEDITGEGDAYNYDLELELPKLLGKYTFFTVRVIYRLQADMTTGVGTVNLKAVTNVGTKIIKSYNNPNSADTGQVATTTSDFADLINEGEFDDILKLQLSGVIGEREAQDSVMDVNLEIFDVQIIAKMELVDSDGSLSDALKDIEYLYTGADGFEKSYDGGSGTAVKPHEIYRDILARFLGWDSADANLTGWSDLDTARSDWKARVKLQGQDPQKVEEILKKLQKEGCFIFQYQPKAGAIGKGARFIFIKDSYESDDIDHVLEFNDYVGIPGIDHIAQSDIISGRDIQYDKHPAKDTYLEKVESRNVNLRTALDFGDKENIVEDKLDYYVAPIPATYPESKTPNSDYASYHANLNGDIKLVGEKLKIVNPLFYGIEPGDTIQFDSENMPLKPYNYDWADLIFMVTKTEAHVGSRSIEYRDIVKLIKETPDEPDPDEANVVIDDPSVVDPPDDEGGISFSAPTSSTEIERYSTFNIVFTPTVPSELAIDPAFDGTVRIDVYRGSSLFDTLTSALPIVDGVEKTYEWHLSRDLTAGDNYSIKILWNTGNYARGESDDFAIIDPEPSEITIDEPDAGEQWISGDVVDIKFTTNFNDNVMIVALKNGVEIDTIAGGVEVTANVEKTVEWAIPDHYVTGSDYQIYFVRHGGDNGNATSGNFTITKPVPTITINEPDAGEQWDAGDLVDIKFTTNFTDMVTIYALKNGVLQDVIASNIEANSAVERIVQWGIPDHYATGSNYQIRIVKRSGDSTIATSGNFTITKPSSTISFNEPDAGEQWNSGDLVDIKFTTNFTDLVGVVVYKNNVWQSVIATDLLVTANVEKTVEWAIPADYATGTDYQIGVIRLGGDNVFQKSGNFTITKPVPTITINEPDAGEQWNSSEIVDIKFTCNFNDRVMIVALKDGVTQDTIAGGVEVQSGVEKTVEWAIPDHYVTGSDYQIYFVRHSGNNVDATSGNFTITKPVPTITIDEPDAGEQWDSGELVDIKFTVNFTDSVIVYVIKNGVMQDVIASGIEVNSAVERIVQWVIPADYVTGSDYQIRIVKRNGDSTIATSGNFTITKPTFSISFNEPDAGDVWEVITSEDIKFTPNFSGIVRVLLYKGSTYKETIGADVEVTANTEKTLSWAISAGLASGTDYKIKILMPNYVYSSSGDFEIDNSA